MISLLKNFRIFPLTFTLKLISILILVLISITLASQSRQQVSFAQENVTQDNQSTQNEGYYDQKAKEAGVVFPVEDLRNCLNYSSCVTYCEDPVNATSCIDYAREKGFYKEEPILEEKFLQAAKAELGCDSAASCMNICDDPANHDKCDSFARKLQITGGYTKNPDSPQFIEKAKEALGCDSFQSCTAVCSDPTNRQKCSEFAQTTGLRGGIQNRGPGGCTSEATCQSYCLDPNNFNECSKWTSGPGGGDRFRGPGGCTSQENCRTYCEENPDACRSYAPGASGRYLPVNCPQNQYFGPGGACTPVEKSQDADKCVSENKYWNGSNCQDKPPSGINITPGAYFQPRTDMGGCTTPGSCYDWCKANPGKCGGFNPDSPRPLDYNPTVIYSSSVQMKYEPKPDMGGCTTPGSCYDWCKANPNQCGGFNPDSPRPPDNYQPYSGSYYQQPYSGSGTYNQQYSGSGTNYQPYSGSNTSYGYQSSSSYQSNPNMGNCTTPGSCYDWCKANPNQCGGFNPDSPRPPDNYQPSSGTYPQPSSGTTYSQPTYTAPTQTQPAPTETQTQPAPDSGSTTPPVQGVKTGPIDTIKSLFKSVFGFFGRI